MKRICAIVLFAAALVSANAQTNLVVTNAMTRVMSLQDCFTEALQHNFDVQHERYEPQKSLYALYAAYAGYDPVFSLSGQHEYNRFPGNTGSTNNYSDQDSFQSALGGTLPLGTTYNLFGNVSDVTTSHTSGGQAGVDLTQPLLQNFWIDSTRLAVGLAKDQLKQSEQGLRQQLITTVTAVENAYDELAYARENVQVEEEALNLAQTQLNQDQERVQVGSLAPLDVQQDEAQVAQSRANLITAQFTLVSDQNTLKNLITDKYLDWHDLDIVPSAPMDAVRQFFDVQDSWSKGMTQRPDLIQAKLDVEQQGIQLKYDRNQIFPQLDLKGSYGYNGSGPVYSDTFGEIAAVNRPFYSYGATLSVPLSNAKARNGYKSDKATEQQLLIALKQLEQNIMVQIDDAVKQAESAWESVQATHEQRTYAEAALDAEQKKYAVGKSTTFTVLQLQNSLTAARSAEIRAVANYNEALAGLAQQEGSTLERRQIDFKYK